MMLHYGRRKTIAIDSLFYMAGPIVMAASYSFTYAAAPNTAVSCCLVSPAHNHDRFSRIAFCTSSAFCTCWLTMCCMSSGSSALGVSLWDLALAYLLWLFLSTLAKLHLLR